jgi:signal transduction histidine kinase/ActR/RegA family two-component response regulator
MIEMASVSHPKVSARASSESPAADVLLVQWRERILSRPTLVLVAGLGSVATAIFAVHHRHPAAWLPVGVVALLVAALSVAAARGAAVAAGVRSVLVLSVAFASGLLPLCTSGLSAEGALGLFGFVALAALLLGTARARGAAWLATGTLVTCGALYTLGALELPDPGTIDPRDPWNWARLVAFASGVIAVVGSGASLLTSELIKALHDRTQLVHQLREENREREHALARLAETQERLLHSHKLEAVGRLAGGIAHDFNNTLTVILSYSELMKARLGPKHPIGELADQIILAAEQGGDLTKQLLTFTRRQVIKPRTIDVQQVLRNTERALSRLVPRSIRVHRVETQDELFIKIDPTQLQQAILNLALNARDAMPDGGDLYLEVAGCELEAGPDVPVLPGAYVAVRVRDTGTGMSDDTRTRMFEPLFTTKEPGLGTGLGLSNVRETTEAAGGFVDVRTTLGSGSELTLYFPRTEARTSGIEATGPVPQPGQARVLVVDDEPQIREVICTMLADRGFVVRAADGAKAALNVLKSESIDLVCTDLVMPDMSGNKLIGEIKLSSPKIPIIVCSAYGIDEDVSRRVARGEVLFMSKPFSSQELLELVHKALTGGRPNGATTDHTPAVNH